MLKAYRVARQLQADVWRDEIYELNRKALPRDAFGQLVPGEVRARRAQLSTLRWLAEKLG